MTLADIWTDFNDITDGNLITALMRHSYVDNVVIRSTYTFGDGEGNWCLGTVESIEGPIIRARLDLTTWHNVDDAPRFVRGSRRVADLLSDPTIAAEVRKIEDENHR